MPNCRRFRFEKASFIDRAVSGTTVTRQEWLSRFMEWIARVGRMAIVATIAVVSLGAITPRKLAEMRRGVSWSELPLIQKAAGVLLAVALDGVFFIAGLFTLAAIAFVGYVVFMLVGAEILHRLG